MIGERKANLLDKIIEASKTYCEGRPMCYYDMCPFNVDNINYLNANDTEDSTRNFYILACAIGVADIISKKTNRCISQNLLNGNTVMTDIFSRIEFLYNTDDIGSCIAFRENEKNLFVIWFNNLASNVRFEILKSDEVSQMLNEEEIQNLSTMQDPIIQMVDNLNHYDENGNSYRPIVIIEKSAISNSTKEE